MAVRSFFSALRDAMVDALRLGDTTPGPVRRPIPTYSCAFIILLMVSSGMLYLGDKLNASGMVLTRFMGAGQAAVTAQIGYPEEGRDQITVVLYDEQFLQAYDSAWPISYQDHADWLLRLAGLPGARPKAIFLDITFGQERDDPTLPALKTALCTLRDSLHIPVFVAALPDAHSGRLVTREGLGACFTMVGADYTPDSLDGYAWAYPLTRRLDETGWTSGPALAAEQPAYRNAALAIAADAGGLALGEETAPLALVWGAVAASGAELADRDRGCVPDRQLLRSLAPGQFLQFFDAPPLCPYHRTLSMEQLGSMGDPELATALAGRYVMVGANIPGHNDFARSPVHGLVPGVHYHAMALDNLLSYGERYKLDLEWDADGMVALALPGMATVLVVLIVHLLWSRGLAWLARHPRWMAARTRLTGLDRLRAWTDEATGRGRTGLAVLGALAWAVRLILQFVSAAVLIAVLQNCSRAGMLPVVELIGMTLLAEAIGYLARLRWYFLGRETPAPVSDNQSAPSPPLP